MKKFRWLRALFAHGNARWACREYGHTNIESKIVGDDRAFRCLDCGEEHAVLNYRYNAGGVPTLWARGLEAQVERDILAKRKQVIDTAFHQDPAQAALTEWRERHQ